MTEESDFGSNLVQHGGWLATIVVGIWGWILKMALAKHLEGLNELNRRMNHLEISVGEIRGHLGINVNDST